MNNSCSLCSDFDGDVAAFNAYKWRYSDVIVIKLTAFIQNEIPYKTYISDFFYIWKTNRIYADLLYGSGFLKTQCR